MILGNKQITLLLLPGEVSLQLLWLDRDERKSISLFIHDFIAAQNYGHFI